MSAVPTLSRWSTFVRSLGGLVGLDMAWETRAWAEFPDDKDGDLEVICELAKGGDLDVTVRPRIEGENVRKHRRLPEAMAAFAYVNPAPSGDGEAVSRDAHRGDWHQINDELAVAVAVGGNVGGVDTGGRGPFLVHKGRLWLPNGEQTPRETEAAKPTPETAVHLAPKTAKELASEAPKVPEGEAANVSVLPRQSQRKPAERRARIFGDEADDLIHQARSSNRRRA